MERTSQALGDIEAALAVIGGKWKVLILAQLAGGPRRYGELRRGVPSVTEKMLIQQLRQLEVDGMVRRTVEETVPPRVEYAMTAFAYSLCPVIEAMRVWGYAYRTERGSEATVRAPVSQLGQRTDTEAE
ncbi:MAG: winged helix-turn-helix transcriptional regulator [Thermomicrobiales bacterium]